MVATKKAVHRCWFIHLNLGRQEFQHLGNLVLWASHFEVINVDHEDATRLIMYKRGWPVGNWTKAKRAYLYFTMFLPVTT
eukprot:4529948-Amphidinium_carterae.1